MDQAVAARSIPQDHAFDRTLGVLSDPYCFIGRLCQHYDSDVVQARIMFQPTLLMRGRDAAELFYDAERFTRVKAAPRPLLKTLFGVGGIQGTDGQEHLHRKQLFLSIATGQKAFELNACFVDWWSTYARRWQSRPRVTLYEQLQELLCRTVCFWAGVPLPESDVEKRTRQLADLFDLSSSPSAKYLRSRWVRIRADQWAKRLIREYRAGRINVPETSPAYLIAMHRGLDGELMNERIAAVELINLLRPTVAVSVYIVFVALALHDYPQCREQVMNGDSEMLDAFVQEVRRFYPFFPSIAARVRHDFEWRGYHFPRGRRVMLDLYGTNHDDRIWESPDDFLPERFLQRSPDPFALIPQGGGDRRVTHRCPGEDIVTLLMKTAADILTHKMDYRVPDQDLQIDFHRLPALPKSRFGISSVRWRGE